MGVRTGIDETTTVEAASSTKMEDVDKLHRVGPPKQGKQDIIVRFKSHTAKENFFRRKEYIKNIGVRPSLAPERSKLLEEAITMLEVEKRTFFSFTSIVGLCATIEKNQERTGEDGDS